MKQKSGWETYYKNTEGRPPRKELVEGIEYVTNKDKALDLGAGALQDSQYLLDQDFKQVIAVDSEPSVEGRLRDDRLHVIISQFEDFNFPTDSIDLVNAQYSLPFTNPQQFKKVFEAVKNALKKDGVFVGQLFGNRDGWNQDEKMTFLSRSEVDDLVHDMEVIKFTEEERDGKTAAGDAKHWHVFNLILRKR